MCEQDLRLLKPRDFGDNPACEPETVKLSLLPANKVWDKVMFLHLSVILFTRGGMHPSMQWGRHPPGLTLPPRQTLPHPWQTPSRILWDMVNKRVVHILLECILLSTKCIKQTWVHARIISCTYSCQWLHKWLFTGGFSQMALIKSPIRNFSFWFCLE